MGACGILVQGRPCSQPVEPGTPLNLCPAHLLAAIEWADRENGVTDVLSAPCAACGSRLGVRYPSGWICAVCEWKVGEFPTFDTAESGRSTIRVDVVYYLRFDDRIKIGTSGNPRIRFSALRHDEVLAFEPGDRLLEQKRHAQFAAHRIPRTEWFEMNDELLEHIRLLRRGVTDPWSRYALWRSEAIALRG